MQSITANLYVAIPSALSTSFSKNAVEQTVFRYVYLLIFKIDTVIVQSPPSKVSAMKKSSIIRLFC